MNKKAIWVSYVILILLIIIAFIFIIFYPKISTELKKYNYNKASKSIVAIISGYDVSKDILTSDVMIDTAFCYKDGYLVTNYHNVTDGDISIITSDNNVFKAEVIAKDETRDIAILTSEANLPALKIADSDKCEKGDNVYSISTPVSAYLRYTYTSGMLTNTNIQGFGTQTLIQTNIDLSPGCSGAPLLNENFEVVGMITLKSTEFGAEGLGFAIPSSNLASYINVLENGDSILDLKLTLQKISIQSMVYQIAME